MKQVRPIFVRKQLHTILQWLLRKATHRLRRVLVRALGCMVLLLVLLMLACMSLFLLVRPAEMAGAPFTVQLLIDNSNSMFELGGVGSDPAQLRMEAARLFIDFLGVDDEQSAHQCGVIFFGETAQTVVPLTQLTDAARREQLSNLIADPPRMGWTDHAAALALARQELSGAAGRPVMIMLTDGKPEWNVSLDEQAQEAYIERLQHEGEMLVAANIPLFIVLLANEATDADPEIASVWRPVWEQLAQATAPGRYYVARQPEDLLAIYHDIVRTLAEAETTGVVVSGVVGTSGLREAVEVEPGLARLTFVVSKSVPEQSVVILRPDGQPLQDDQPGVRYAGRPGTTRAEIWVVDNPEPGEWAVTASGAGSVTVWKDYYPASPTSTLPAVTPSLTPTGTPSPTPLPTATSAVTLTIATGPQPATVVSLPRVVKEVPVDPPGSPAAPSRWPLIMVVAALCMTFGIWIVRRRQQGPLVAGELYVLQGTGFGTGQMRLELEALRRPHVRIGAPPSEVPLAGVTEHFTIRPGRNLGGVHEMLLSSTGDVLLDGRPLRGEQPLQDTMLITFGPHQFRYDNLRLRQVMQSLAWKATSANARKN